jgi:hypothetical protein
MSIASLGSVLESMAVSGSKVLICSDALSSSSRLKLEPSLPKSETVVDFASRDLEEAAHYK